MNQPNWNRTFEKAPESFHTRMESVLNALPEQEEPIMKSMKNVKRTVLVAAAAVAVLCTSVFAGIQMGYIRSDWRNTYSLKTPEAVERALGEVEGITPEAKFLESYSNGFTFEKGLVDGCEARNDDDPTVYRYQSIDSTYIREDERVHVDICPLVQDVTTNHRGETVMVNGVTVYTLEQDYKVVKEDYVKTAEEEELEAQGALIFSYDDTLDLPNEFQQRYISWEQDGMRYSISTSTDASRMEIADLLQMAQELMES